MKSVTIKFNYTDSIEISEDNWVRIIICGDNSPQSIAIDIGIRVDDETRDELLKSAFCDHVADFVMSHVMQRLTKRYGMLDF